MKRTFFYGLLLLMGFVSMAFNCSSDDDGSSIDQSAYIAETNAIVTTDTWRISSFVDSGSDETHHFMDYQFTFGGNGALSATNGSDTVVGTWSITSDDSSDDDGSSSNDIDFNIGFTSPANFAELSEDWHIVSRTSTKIDLKHISGGNGGTDTLTFEMN